jgi:hypothetical protein
MDINQLETQAKLSFDHAVAKKNLTERMQSRLTVSHQGGVFRVDADLFVLLSLTEGDEMVILDSYDTPILVNRKELCDTAKQRYFELTNEWLAEWERLKKIRKAEDV